MYTLAWSAAAVFSSVKVVPGAVAQPVRKRLATKVTKASDKLRIDEGVMMFSLGWLIKAVAKRGDGVAGGLITFQLNP